MEDGRKILFYISLQAREATYSCSGSPVTGTCQPGTNALLEGLNTWTQSFKEVFERHLGKLRCSDVEAGFNLPHSEYVLKA